MNPYIITLIGIGLLGPVIFFVPSNIAVKGKWVLLFASFIIAETGVLALNIFPYWQAAGVFLLLIILTSYLLHNRAGSIFIDSAEMETGAAKEKSDEPEMYSREQEFLSKESHDKDATIMDEEFTESDKARYLMVESVEGESGAEQYETDITPGNSVKLDDTDILPEEIMELAEENQDTEGSTELDEPEVFPGTIMEPGEMYMDMGDSSEVDESGTMAGDNSEYIIDGRLDADVMEYIEEVQEEKSRESSEESRLVPEITDEESDSLTGESKEQEGENSYLASIEKMLEEGDMYDLDAFESGTEPFDSTDIKQNELTEELESLAEEAEDADQESNNSPNSEETDSIIQADMDSEDIVQEEWGEMPVPKEDTTLEDGGEEDILSTAVEGISNSLQRKELNNLIIESLKFAQFEMDLESYISLLENQLQKELPVQMNYEIALMLIHAFFKAGQFSKSMDVIEEMKSELGHLPAVSLELETLFRNVKKSMQ
ncbi:hypothetical protein LC048_04345 [Mesobacillus subterraneus]|uniref:hypothetical protein n=1 Tax=Mesobacillus subterraneus TaxID=285983 RepID=UPI001CFEEAFF|nr:hypothetical protein [Mesobacillus subterraneus]WLR56181.1 hypothetical protein LC048_04345 [Mesobacillus subterraneus]